ncbi:MAG: GIY-YIG nuclease family protein [Candidatus Moranbacteria bacterium]|nr:GIY-YIG nuclease family protein [Candidatus Moranbacteria bacterium]
MNNLQKNQKKAKWKVYILKCSDETFYTGITTDLDRRIEQHNSSPLGAKYTFGRRPVELFWAKKFNNRSLASKEECRIKKLPRAQKLELIV